MGHNIAVFVLYFIAEPSAPRNLTVTDVEPESITVSWQAPESDGGAKLKRYVIVMKEVTTKKYKKVGKVDPDTLTFKITKDIQAGAEYNIQV